MDEGKSITTSKELSHTSSQLAPKPEPPVPTPPRMSSIAAELGLSSSM
jgi:hypothetical protein